MVTYMLDAICSNVHPMILHDVEVEEGDRIVIFKGDRPMFAHTCSNTTVRT